MVFSSTVFLFVFLPVVLAAYAVLPGMLRNFWLLGASLLFYAWGGIGATLLFLGLIAFNFVAGRLIERFRDTPAAPWVLGLCVVADLIPLAYFKYAAFAAETLSSLVPAIDPEMIAPLDTPLPLGISFVTFQAMSYLIDVYRREAAATRNPIDVALYIAFFPQLIAGPIVRYVDIADQLRTRETTVGKFAEGIERFVCGLAKKVLLANSAAAVADQIFLIPGEELTGGVAWLGIVCYTLQIYYDFSGYSDMAVGLGLLFGFRLPENFDYPYVARSITEFWRRWHITLSTWFRNYVYIPLGGNRRGATRTYLNLLIVFLLCGLWHGASWNFVLWGLYYGAFLVLERAWLGDRLARLPRVAAVAYVLPIVMLGWVLFRTDNLAHAAAYYRALFGLGTGSGLEYHLGMYVDFGLYAVLAAGALGAAPWLPVAKQAAARLVDEAEAGRRAWAELAFGCGRITGLAGLLVVVAVVLSASTYNPFIYFRF